MKSINQILKKYPELLDNDSVQELIEYCRQLEDEVLDQKLIKPYNKENLLIEFLFEISNSCGSLITDDQTAERFNQPRTDFKTSIIALRKNIMKFFEDNNIRI